MSKIIPNQNTWVGFATARPASLSSPSVATDLAAALNVTPVLITINASSQGNTVPTPTLDSLFETSVPGTNTASFTADFYRDDINDVVYQTLRRGIFGFFYISRFGGLGPLKRPNAGQGLETWPVQVVSSTAAGLTSNTAQTFTVTCSVPEQPVENAIAVA